MSISGKKLNEAKEFIEDKENKSIIGAFENWFRTLQVYTPNGNKNNIIKIIEHIYIYNKNGIMFPLSRFLEGYRSPTNTHTEDYEYFVISTPKKRTKENFSRKENFIIGDSLYLCNELDINVKDISPILFNENEFEIKYIDSITIEVLGDNFILDKEKNEVKEFSQSLSGTITRTLKPLGEEREKIKKAFEEKKIKVNEYELMNILKDFLIIPRVK